MKGILIDPYQQNVTWKDFDFEDYRTIQKTIDADTFDVTRIAKEEVMYIDDEGLMKEQKHYFTLELMHEFGKKARRYEKADVRSYVGKALILSDGGIGEALSTKMELGSLNDGSYSIIDLYYDKVGVAYRLKFHRLAEDYKIRVPKPRVIKFA
tara:strand:+ start:792 stop:1250 length:459 start_codon:yes stop_codon:yes gene_type:complete